MKKSVKWTSCLSFIFLMVVSPVKVNADIGPKPSVVIDFIGLEDETYYVTLLSEKDSTGPWSYGNEYYEYLGDEAVFQKFSEYKDVDGYYFLSFMKECSGDDTFEWTYYPPGKFKILLYFPERDLFVESNDVYERYAFDSYFTVRISEMQNADVSSTIEVQQTYDFTMEIISLIVRIILTIGVELIVAILFKYRDKKSLSTIAIVNIFTQMILNVLLNIVNYRSGQYAFVFHYIWMEIVVFAIEAIIYCKFIDKLNKTNKERHPIFYAAIANIVSFVIGIWITRVIPGIF